MKRSRSRKNLTNTSSNKHKNIPFVGELETCARKMLVVCHQKTDSMFIPELVAGRFNIDYIFTNDICNADFTTDRLNIFDDIIKTDIKFDMIMLLHCPFKAVLGNKYSKSSINKMIQNLEILAPNGVILTTLSKHYMDMFRNGVKEEDLSTSSRSSYNKYSYFIGQQMTRRFGPALEIRFKDEKKFNNYLYSWKV